MKLVRGIIVLMSGILWLNSVGCQSKSSAAPLSLATVQQLNRTNTTSFSFQESKGEIVVSITDQNGDGHLHILNHDGMTKQEALQVLTEKQRELEPRS